MYLFVFTEKIAKPKYVKTGTGKGRGRPPKRLAPTEENGEELDEEAETVAVPLKKRPKYVKTGTGKGRGRPPKAAPKEIETEIPDEEEESSQKTEESAEIDETEEENDEEPKTEVLIDDGFSV